MLGVRGGAAGGQRYGTSSGGLALPPLRDPLSARRPPANFLQFPFGSVAAGREGEAGSGAEPSQEQPGPDNSINTILTQGQPGQDGRKCIDKVRYGLLVAIIGLITVYR